jgi:hypothetical protein
MAKSDSLPPFAKKRAILFGLKTSEAKLRATGEQFLAAGRHDDALEFFQRGGAEDMIRGVQDQAVDVGNVPLLMRACRALKQQPTRQQWTAAAKKAETNGMFSSALLAWEQAGDEAGVERVRPLVPGIIDEVEPEEDADPLSTDD